MKKNPFLAGVGLGRYGDKRAVPMISDVIDALPLNDPMHTARELAFAIEDLGGTLTPAQRRKVDSTGAREIGRRARYLRELRRELGGEKLRPVASADRPGRREAACTNPLIASSPRGSER